MQSSSGDASGQDRSETPRDRAADARDETATARDGLADGRDATADERDRSADERDRAGDERDRAAEGRDAAGDERDRRAERRDRRASAADRASARRDRAAASRDRAAGTFERGNALADRAAARVDRDVSATEREAAHVDELTGAYRRGSGFRELEREMLRALRDGTPLTVAFVDVDHLKHVNDSCGHAAGDVLLQQVAGALRAKLRPYDMVIRYGGDEFVAVLSGLGAEAAATRLASINSVLRTMSPDASMSVGVAEMGPGDSPAELVRRADEALYRGRQARP